MTDKTWKDELKKKLKEHASDAVDTANSAVAGNVGRSGTRASVSSRQRVVQRDGKTVRVEERVERRDR